MPGNADLDLPMSLSPALTWSISPTPKMEDFADRLQDRVNHGLSPPSDDAGGTKRRLPPLRRDKRPVGLLLDTGHATAGAITEILRRFGSGSCTFISRMCAATCLSESSKRFGSRRSSGDSLPSPAMAM
jgi:hypothetical protein